MQVFLTKRCFLLFWYSPILGQYRGEERSPASLSSTEKRIELKQIELCRRLFSPPKTPKVRAEPHFPWSIIRRTAHFYYIWGADFFWTQPKLQTQQPSMETQVENMHIDAAADPVVRADPIVPADAATTLDNFGYDFNFDAFVGAVNTVDSTLIGAKITLKKLTDRATCPSSVCDAVNLFKLGLKSLTDLCKAAAEMDNEALCDACRTVKGMKDLIDQQTEATTADLFKEPFPGPYLRVPLAPLLFRACATCFPNVPGYPPTLRRGCATCPKKQLAHLRKSASSGCPG
ncbi:hypothetical protein PAPYR_11053 [Paratrimastix pyriformis]|uniref:Uncharacterized protein n=1 Tax=Paratrimastix pyriformis TaxID=342808 RepID=A0ABQ8UAC2_9EUKA|nr:hypothetical protein PAPYR_11053 [Paratrimastix pyriformis]